MNRFPFPLAGLWWVACLVLQVALAERAVDVSTNMLSWLWIGSMWAGWSACLWGSTAIQSRWARLLLIALGIAWHSAWMSQARDEPMLRYLIMFGGYAAAQSIFFRYFRVPGWSFHGLQHIDGGRRQFAIFEWLVFTTLTALLLTGAKRYQPAAADVFWSGLPVVCVSLAATATLCALAMVSETRRQRRLFAYSSLIAVALGSVVTAWLESRRLPSVSLLRIWLPYYGIQSVFAMLLATFAACGRVFPLAPADVDVDVDADAGVRTTDPPHAAADASQPSDDLLPFRQPPRR